MNADEEVTPTPTRPKSSGGVLFLCYMMFGFSFVSLATPVLVPGPSMGYSATPGGCAGQLLNFTFSGVGLDNTADAAVFVQAPADFSTLPNPSSTWGVMRSWSTGFPAGPGVPLCRCLPLSCFWCCCCWGL